MLFGLGKDKDKAKDRAKKAGAAAFGRNSGNRLRGRGAAALSRGVSKLFHGVAVRARGDACCEAVDSLGTRRFLSEEAPLLPLAKCSNPQGCRCVYEHFDERRGNLRRETDIGLPVRALLEDKREGLGRRITDG